MEGYDASTYGDRIADVYDELYEDLFDVEGTVSFLAELAGDGRVLELAIGTGRIAVPLTERGVSVEGIDASQAMVAKLRDRAGGADIAVTRGDFADVAVDAEFSLVYLVFNTLFALTNQERQIQCFENVARHLIDGGYFVVEAFVPDMTRFDQHQRVAVDEVRVDEVRLEMIRHDPVAQRSYSQHVFISEAGTKLYPVSIRYCWPSELDLMARLVGLTLHERWGGWRREPFTSESKSHVSVYVKMS